MRTILHPISPTLAIRLTIAVTVIVGVHCAHANDVVPSASSGGSMQPPKLLVLPTGDVIGGDIRITNMGYEVEITPKSGRVFLAKELVWFTADSLSEAYDELKVRFPDKSANGYVQLANWCAQQGLYDEAKVALRDALQLEPENTSALLAAKELGKLISQSPRPNPGITTTPTALPNDHPSVQKERADAQSQTQSLDDETRMRLYVKNVQPLLINSCAAAKCHGRSSERPFALMNVRSGHPAFKAFTEQNLATVRKWISAETADEDRIATRVQDTAHQSWLRAEKQTPSGQRSWQIFEYWVKSEIAARRNETPTDSPEKLVSHNEPAPHDDSSMVQNAFYEEPVEPEPGCGQPTFPFSESDPTSDPMRPDVEQTLQDAIDSGAPDAFDPNEFNRRFTSETDNSATSLSNGATR